MGDSVTSNTELYSLK